MSVRPTMMAILLVSATLAFAGPAQASTSGLCEEVTTPVLHVGVAVDGRRPCSQDCPSMVNVNVAVSITGDIEQCSGSGSLLNSQANAPLCGIVQGPWQGDCEDVAGGLWDIVDCVLNPRGMPCFTDAGPAQPVDID